MKAWNAHMKGKELHYLVTPGAPDKLKSVVLPSRIGDDRSNVHCSFYRRRK